MKSVKIHCKADRILLGHSDPFIHSMLDSSVKILGPAHRYDYHDFKTVMWIDKWYGSRASDVALLHILLDFHILDDKFILKLIKGN